MGSQEESNRGLVRGTPPGGMPVIPVTVRPAPPEVPLPPSAPPGAGQTFVYVNVPSAAPAPQAPQASTTHIHYHTTVIQAPAQLPPQAPPPNFAPPTTVIVERLPRRARRRRKASSSLAGIALLMGALACVQLRMHWNRPDPLILAGGGFVLGLVALAAAQLFGSRGRGLPIASLLVCGIAFGIAIGWNLSNAAPAAQSINAMVQQEISAATPALQHVLDSGNPTTAPVAPAPAPAAISKPPPSPAAVIAPEPAPNTPTIAQAQAELASAETAVMAKLSSDPQFISAQHAADQAKVDLDAARATEPPGSPTLTELSQKWIDAKGVVQRMMSDAEANDPRWKAAHTALETLRARARSAPPVH